MCKKLKFVKNVIVIGGKTVDNYVLSLNDFVKKNQDSKLNIEELVKKKVDLKDQSALIFSSSGTTGNFNSFWCVHTTVIVINMQVYQRASLSHTKM